MAKRRTRKQKTTARHEFTVSWDPKMADKRSGAQKKAAEVSYRSVAKNVSSPQPLLDSSKIKKDIFKSLILAGLIIGIEIALYFTWQK